MKGGAGFVFGCAISLAASLALVIGFAALGVWLQPGAEEADSGLSAREPRYFERAEDAGGFTLSFGFRDHGSATHQVTCRVARADLERERDSFGFAEDALWARFNAQLQALVDGEIRQREIAAYFSFEAHGRGAYRWSWRVEGGTPEPEYARAVAATRALGRWLEEAFPERRQELKKALVAPHGFRLDPEGALGIDYPRLVDWGTGSLADCQRALVLAAAGADWPRYLSQFLAFFQDLEYEVPPVREDGRYTLGLWVPTEVLVRGRGDCDSKSVALASMLRRFGRRILFIVLPKHALIGVEMTPHPGQRFVRLGNRYFVLCDPAGPARIPPGGQALEGSYEYMLIEPVGVAS